jgi:hypothetical protein
VPLADLEAAAAAAVAATAAAAAPFPLGAAPPLAHPGAAPRARALSGAELHAAG